MSAWRWANAMLASVFTTMIGTAHATPVNVDLTPWKGDGSWIVAPGGASVTQNDNSPTIAFFTGENDIDKRFQGTVEVQTTEDDDFLGFVLGYREGDISPTSTNSGIDYLLVDWKQGDHKNWDQGLAVSRVTGNIYEIGNSGSISPNSDAWKHTGDVDFITRSNVTGAAFANTGWEDNTVYNFSVDYTAERVSVSINGNLEIDILAADAGVSAFSEGSFGFYGFSQEKVRYAAITEEDISPVPLPAGLPMLGIGLGALAWMRRRRAC